MIGYDAGIDVDSDELTGPMADYFWKKWLLGGVGTILFAAVLHFRYYWKNTRRLEEYWQPLWYVSAMILMVSFLLTIAVWLAMFLRFI